MPKKIQFADGAIFKADYVAVEWDGMWCKAEGNWLGSEKRGKVELDFPFENIAYIESEIENA